MIRSAKIFTAMLSTFTRLSKKFWWVLLFFNKSKICRDV